GPLIVDRRALTEGNARWMRAVGVDRAASVQNPANGADARDERDRIRDQWWPAGCRWRLRNANRKSALRTAHVDRGIRYRLFHRHAFREVARLVDIRPAQHGGVIREQLQRHDVHDRGEESRVLGHPDEVNAVAGGEMAVEVGDDIELAAARAYF